MFNAAEALPAQVNIHYSIDIPMDLLVMEARKNPVLLRCRLCLVKPMRASFEYHSALLSHWNDKLTSCLHICRNFISCWPQV